MADCQVQKAIGLSTKMNAQDNITANLTHSMIILSVVKVCHEAFHQNSADWCCLGRHKLRSQFL